MRFVKDIQVIKPGVRRRVHFRFRVSLSSISEYGQVFTNLILIDIYYRKHINCLPVKVTSYCLTLFKFTWVVYHFNEYYILFIFIILVKIVANNVRYLLNSSHYFVYVCILCNWIYLEFLYFFINLNWYINSIFYLKLTPSFQTVKGWLHHWPSDLSGRLAAAAMLTAVASNSDP